MATFAERFKTALEIRNISAADIARRLGASEGTISDYKKGLYEPKQRRTEAIAQILDVSIPWLMGADVPMEIKISNVVPIASVKKIPILGQIACGEPLLAEENIEDYILEPKNTRANFALICKGDSMINARIFDGDIVYIREQPDVENGEIAAVLLDNEATLKRVYKYNNRIELRPENPTYNVINVEGSNLNIIRILGKVVGFYSENIR